MTELTKDIDVEAITRFMGDDARVWEVREIRNPILSNRRGFFRHPEFADGWLLFMSGEERRRLAPFPEQWRHATDEQLRKWCEDAMTVRPPTPA